MRAVNVDAGFYLSRELARQLIAGKTPGSFLLLTSLHAGTPRNLPHYSTSKAALSMLVKELAKTLGRFGGGKPATSARGLPAFIRLGTTGISGREHADISADVGIPNIAIRIDSEAVGPGVVSRKAKCDDPAVAQAA